MITGTEPDAGQSRPERPAFSRLHAVALGYSALLRTRNEKPLLAEICKLLVDAGGYRFAWVGLAEQDSARTISPVAQAGFEPGYLSALHVTWSESGPGSGPMGAVIRNGQPFVARHILHDPACAAWRLQAARRGFAAVAYLPLLTAGRALGALALYATDPDAFDTAETGLLQAFSGDLAFALAELRGRAASVLAEEQLQLRARALHAFNQPLAFTDLDGVILYANPAFWHAFARAETEAPGQALAAFAVRPDQAADLLRQVRETGQARGAFQGLGPNGAPLELEVDASAIRDEMGTPLNAFFSFRSHPDFLSGISHALRTPLNAVIGFSEVLLDPSAEPLHPKQREYVSHILESGLRLQHLVDRALNRSETESDKPAPVNRGREERSPGMNPEPPSQTVLLVEDNALNMKLTSAALARAGYKVIWAGSAEDGLPLAEQAAPGLILMDIGLPGMDGLEATRRLKQNPATQAIPVIAFTAHDRDKDRQQALAAGCATLIAKPIRLKNFLETIGAYLPPPAVAPR